jgi:hypothetical protein
MGILQQLRKAVADALVSNGLRGQMARTCFVGFILSAALCFTSSAQTNQLLHGRGGEWLSWTPVHRTAYVQGFADGYMLGFYRACDLADQLFETDKPHRLGDEHHPTEVPSGRCLAHRGEFSRTKLDEKGQVDLSAYTDVVTAFYKKHTSCRDFPFPFLLQTLSSEYATADQLYESALKGGLKGYELRSREWCSGENPQAAKP